MPFKSLISCRVLIFVLALCLGGSPVQASGAPAASTAKQTEDSKKSDSMLNITASASPEDSEVLSRLSAPAQEVAKDLDIVPAVEQLLKKERSTTKDSIESLRLRQQLLEEIIEVSFEIRSAISHIDDDIAATNELHEVMDDRRQSRVQKANVANFMTTGTADILSNSMTSFPQTTGFGYAAGTIGVVGGAISLGLSAYTLRLNQGEHLSRPAEPNMLSHIFGYEGRECEFPQGVWNYLNDPYPGTESADETRRAHLIKVWERLSRINALSTPAGIHRISVLTGVVPLHKELTIDLLEDRALMLADLRAAVSQMDREMYEIMHWIRSL